MDVALHLGLKLGVNERGLYLNLGALCAILYEFMENHRVFTHDVIINYRL